MIHRNGGGGTTHDNLTNPIRKRAKVKYKTCTLKTQTFGNTFQNDNRISMPEVAFLLFSLCLKCSKITDTQNTPVSHTDNPSYTGSNKTSSTLKWPVENTAFEEWCARWSSLKSHCNNSRNPKACKAMETALIHLPRYIWIFEIQRQNQGEKFLNGGKNVSDAPEVLPCYY